MRLAVAAPPAWAHVLQRGAIVPSGEAETAGVASLSFVQGG